MNNNIIYNIDDGAASVRLYAEGGTVWMSRNKWPSCSSVPAQT